MADHVLLTLDLTVGEYRALTDLAGRTDLTPTMLAARLVRDGTQRATGTSLRDWSPYTHHDPLDQTPYVEPWPGSDEWTKRDTT